MKYVIHKLTQQTRSEMLEHSDVVDKGGGPQLKYTEDNETMSHMCV